MRDINIKDLIPSETVEIIVSHNNPLKYTKVGKEEYKWVIEKAKGSQSQEEITHFSGMVSANNVDDRIVSVYGGPYSAKGLSSQFCSRGIVKEASADILWQYI